MPKPDLYDRLRADQSRAEALTHGLPRRTPSNPWTTSGEPERRTYADPTATRAIANVMREQARR